MDSFLGNLSQGQSYSTLQTGMVQQGLQNVNTSGIAQQISSDAILQQLQPGDTFQGEIMSVNGQEVQLQLANGQYMVARLEGEIQLALGQLLNFQVQSNQNSKIILKPVYTNLLQQRVGESALKAANLAVNDKNLQMVSKLIENGMSIDKNSLVLFNRQLIQHSQAKVESLIRLNQLGVKVNDANLTQLEHYQNLEHKLSDGIEEAVKDIGKLYEAIAGESSEMIMPNGQNSSLLKAGTFMEKILHFLMEETQESLNKEGVTGSKSIEGNAVTEPARQETTPILEESIQTREDIAKELTPKVEETLPEELQQKNNLSNNCATDRMPDIVKQFQGMPQEQVIDKIQSFLKQGKLNVDTLNELLLSEQGIGKKLPPESKDKLYRSEEFQKLLKDTLQKEWSLSPKELTEDDKIKEFYQKLVRQSGKLSQLMEQAAAQSQTNAGNALQNIRENVEFMNQMNQMFQYVQLPLKLSGTQAQGELYVYTNKRNLAKKEGVLTAILHLDLEHLGNMDINLSLNMDTEQVISRFYLEEDSIALLEEHIEELTQRLIKKGYHSQSFLEKRISEKTVFEQIEEQAGATAAPVMYQNFDIRT